MGRKMKLSVFAENENVSADILRAAITDHELSSSLDGHIHYIDDGSIEIDDEAAYVLHRYLQMSGIVLQQDNHNSLSQKAQKRLFIAIVILIFLYYMLAIVLEAMGKITTWGMSFMLLPVLAIVGIAYLRNKKKREEKM